MMRKSLLIGLFAFSSCVSLWAHDIVVKVQGQTLYFNILDKKMATAEVTYGGSITDRIDCDIKGKVQIPAKIKYKNVVYQVTSIGPKAFSGAKGLTGVVLPSTLTDIKDFAFENCPKLSNVVFPGGSLNFGEGTFFKCTSLSSLSFGSDWKKIDFKPFCWSDSLQEVSIPAKVEKIRNLKALKSLQKVNVDVNNTRFSSYEGVLYDKSGRVLYGVPRSLSGQLVVKAGTVTVTNGALIDCPYITKLVLPATLQYISFRETSRMSCLKEIVFKSQEIINTAYSGDKGVFLLQVASPEVKIVVPKENKKTYEKSLVQISGEYAEKDETPDVTYLVRANELPKKKNIKGVKNFSQYE